MLRNTGFSWVGISNELPVVIFGDHTRAVKYVDFPFAMGADGVKVLKPKDSCDAKYLYHFLLQAKIPSAGYSRHYKFVKDLKIPLPPLPEQRRIAAILDKADALRAKRREAIAKLDQLLQAVFLDMFGDPVTNPKGWPRCTLGELVLSVKDGPHVSPVYSDTGIPFLSTRHIRAGSIRWEELKYISQSEAETHWRKCKPERGDILYTKGGTTGLAATVDTDTPFAVWVHVALLKTNFHKSDPMWLTAMLNFPYCYQQSQRYTRGIANRDLGLKRMVQIEMYCPPLTLQRQYRIFAENLENARNRMLGFDVKLDNMQLALRNNAFGGNL